MGTCCSTPDQPVGQVRESARSEDKPEFKASAPAETEGNVKHENNLKARKLEMGDLKTTRDETLDSIQGSPAVKGESTKTLIKEVKLPNAEKTNDSQKNEVKTTTKKGTTVKPDAIKDPEETEAKSETKKEANMKADAVKESPENKEESAEPKDAEHEIKSIMTALEKGGTNKEVEHLEKRLSVLSKHITMERKPVAKEKNPLSSIQEKKDPISKQLTQKTVRLEADDNSTDSSSDEDDASSSSGSDPENDAADGDVRGARVYSQSLKNKAQIDALSMLTAGLPKLRKTPIKKIGGHYPTM